MSENVEELKQQLADANQRAAEWEKLHTEAEIKQELMRAAEEGGAHRAFQLMPYLQPHAKLIEVNGQHLVRIAKTDDNGQEVLFTPKEAVAHLRQTKGLGNLFKSEEAAQPATAAPEKIDWRTITPQKYLELRRTHPELLGLDPNRPWHRR
jgi:hypothetical protein